MKHVLIEAFVILSGVFVALLIGKVASWAYPLAHDDVWLVTGVSIVLVLILGIAPMRRAIAAMRNPQSAQRQGAHRHG